MRKEFKFIAMAMAAAVMVACSDESKDDDNTTEVTRPYVENEITGVVTLSADSTYYLKGAVEVKAGGELVINEGVTLIAEDGDDVSYIMIEQGAKINAVGTASKPIVMTSEVKNAGAWGGIHICGKAPINTGIPSISEVGEKNYGGTDPKDNSGTMKYVRLEYTGYSYSEEQECNGISFYGVGSGTTVSYVQAYRGSDDGFEFFGGTVNIDHAVSTSCSDDSFDWTDGWRGCGQFLVVYQEKNDGVLGYKTDCFLECDNGKERDNVAMSHPTLANLSMFSENGDAKKDGVMLKAGTQISLYNSIISGKEVSVSFKAGDAAITNYTSKLSVLAGVAYDGKVAVKTEDEKENVTYPDADADVMAIFNAAGNKSSEISFSGYKATVTETVAPVKVVSQADQSFKFQEVDFIGAMGSEDWTKGWTL